MPMQPRPIAETSSPAPSFASPSPAPWSLPGFNYPERAKRTSDRAVPPGRARRRRGEETTISAPASTSRTRTSGGSSTPLAVPGPAPERRGHDRDIVAGAAVDAIAAAPDREHRVGAGAGAEHVIARPIDEPVRARAPEELVVALSAVQQRGLPVEVRRTAGELEPVVAATAVDQHGRLLTDAEVRIRCRLAGVEIDPRRQRPLGRARPIEGHRVGAAGHLDLGVSDPEPCYQLDLRAAVALVGRARGERAVAQVELEVGALGMLAEANLDRIDRIDRRRSPAAAQRAACLVRAGFPAGDRDDGDDGVARGLVEHRDLVDPALDPHLRRRPLWPAQVAADGVSDPRRQLRDRGASSETGRPGRGHGSPACASGYGCHR